MLVIRPLAVGALGTTVAACLMIMIKMSVDLGDVENTCYKDHSNLTTGLNPFRFDIPYIK
jgi:hypothetical protein